MLTRFASCAPPGLLVTLALIWIMQALITSGESLSPGERIRLPTTLRNVVLPPPVHPTEPPPPPKHIDPPRPLPGPGVSIPLEPTTEQPRWTSPRAPQPGPTTVTLTANPASDGPLINLVRIEPEYPPSALARGLEGFATLRFDVMPDGRVRNVALVESSSPLFDQAAIRAAERFRFKARVVDGEPVATYGVTNRFRFHIDDD